ncbi:MAG: hypothetical protein LBU34_17115 [Planctomycetaceae bacterium]|jgi:uncharacterized protein YozE (UPF0346 family)|nr:hypothetical protein [Planctomycetaceae bacterium]
MNNIRESEIQKFKETLICSLKLLGITLTDTQCEIIDCGCPHKTDILPDNKMGIYSFFYKGKCLKIGKAGTKSKARYNSQHYNPDSSKSNLAKSIITDTTFPVKNLDNNNVGDWIKQNTQRINILIDNNSGKFLLNYIESFMQLYYKPKYEGS